MGIIDGETLAMGLEVGGMREEDFSNWDLLLHSAKDMRFSGWVGGGMEKVDGKVEGPSVTEASPELDTVWEEGGKEGGSAVVGGEEVDIEMGTKGNGAPAVSAGVLDTDPATELERAA